MGDYENHEKTAVIYYQYYAYRNGKDKERYDNKVNQRIVIMNYKYAVNQNYEDFASGRVLYNAKNVPNYPVRLINEMYGRCLSYSVKKENICLYDCCCGGGYSLTVLGFLNQSSISSIIGSDIDKNMLTTAERNLSLLTREGLLRRKHELQEMYKKYSKDSHREAQISADKLSTLLKKTISVAIFQADALNLTPQIFSPDIIITDIPYGNLVEWHGNDNCLDKLIDSLKNIASKNTILAVSMDKGQKITQTSIKRLEHQVIGKRKFEIFTLN